MISSVSGLATLLFSFSFLPTAFGQFQFTSVPNFVGPCEPLFVQWQGGAPPFQAAIRIPDPENSFAVERRFNITDRSLNLTLTDQEIKTDQLDVVIFDANNQSIGTEGRTLLVVANDCDPNEPAGTVGATNDPTSASLAAFTSTPSDTLASTTAPPQTYNSSADLPTSASVLPVPSKSPDRASRPPLSSGILAGISAAAVIMIALFILIAWFVRRRQRLRRLDEMIQPSVYTASRPTSDHVAPRKVETGVFVAPRAFLRSETQLHDQWQPELSPAYASETSSILPLYTRPYNPRTTSLLNSPLAVTMAHDPFIVTSPRELKPLRSADAESFFSTSDTPHIDSVTEATRKRLVDIQRKLSQFESEIDTELASANRGSVSSVGRLAEIERKADSLLNEKGRITGTIPPPAYGPETIDV